MDPFVRRLVERMLEPSAPLSRNRHFHTFDTPEGRTALRMTRRLRSLRKDILACLAEGRPARFIRQSDAEGTHRIELRMERIRGRRVCVLPMAEFELLRELPGVGAGLVEGAAQDAA
jgi:hypothetical protein